jgi:hypothetical protein
MPSVAAWVDGLREAFGAETINPMLRSMYACENGKTIGQQKPYKRAVAVSDMESIAAYRERQQKALASVKPLAKRRR